MPSKNSEYGIEQSSDDKNAGKYQADRGDKKQQEDDSSKKAAGIAAKGVLDYYTGGKGGQIYDAAKKIPGVGKKIDQAEEKLGKGLNKATGGKFGKAANKLDNVGALDAADKALSINEAGGGNNPTAAGASGASPSGSGNGSGINGANGPGKGQVGLPKMTGLGKNDDLSESDNNQESSNNGGQADTDIIGKLSGSGPFKNPKLKIIIGGVVFMFFLIFMFTTTILKNEDGSDPEDKASACVGNSQILEIALAEVGNNEANGTHAKYLSMLGLSPNVAWCAAFVSWCANEAGIPVTEIPHTASVASFLAYFKTSGSFNYISSDYKPNAGDLIIWQALGKSHIGIVNTYDESTGILTTVEGNSSDAVRINTYQYSNLASQGVVGFATLGCGMSTTGTIAGSTIDIPQNFNQTFSTVTCYDYRCNSGKEMIWTNGTKQRRVSDIWKSQGSVFEDGLAVINVNGINKYLIATAQTFGFSGDQIDIYFADGTVMPCILADSKSLFDSNITKYGHRNERTGSINILEYQIQRSYYQKYGNPGSNGWRTNLNKNVVKIVNGGSIL